MINFNHFCANASNKTHMQRRVSTIVTRNVPQLTRKKIIKRAVPRPAHKKIVKISKNNKEFLQALGFKI